MSAAAVQSSVKSKKFGRGLNNVTEFARLGEMRRSMEQTAMWDHPGNAFSTGFIRGLNRSMARTVVGAYELVTAPIPPYDPVFTSKNRVYPDASVRNKRYPWGGLTLAEHPVYPDSYRPNLLAVAPGGSSAHGAADAAPVVQLHEHLRTDRKIVMRARQHLAVARYNHAAEDTILLVLDRVLNKVRQDITASSRL